MHINAPLDKILNSEARVRALRIFCQASVEVSGRQMARMIGVTPKTAHEILQSLLSEGVLIMRAVGKTYLFRLNEERGVARDVLKPLFLAEKILNERLLDIIRQAIKRSALKEEILSVALFGSVHEKKELAASDVDLFIVVKTAQIREKIEMLFSEIDQQVSSLWGNLISPYINSIAEFKTNARKKTGPVAQIVKSYHLIYGERLEKLLR